MDGKLLEELSRSDGYFTVTKIYVKFFKDFVTAGVWSEILQLRNQARYRSDDDWFHFTYDKIAEDMLISPYKAKECVHVLLDKEYLSLKRSGIPAKIYYRVNYEILLEDLYASIGSTESSTKFRPCESAVSRVKSETSDQENHKPEDNREDTPATLQQNSETADSQRLINKESKDFKDSVSKETGVSSQLPRLKLRSQASQQNTPESKPTLVKRSQSLSTNKDIETIIKYWNTFDLFQSHQIKAENKTYLKLSQLLSKLLTKHSATTITESIDKYYKLITRPNTILILKAPGHVVKHLYDFLIFEGFTKERILINNEGKEEKNNPIHGIDSWFEECLNDWDYLTRRFDKQPTCLEDKYPDVTKALAKLYRERINPNPLTNKEINTLIEASAKLVAYHNNMKSKLNFSSCSLERTSIKLFARHMIESILENVEDTSIVDVRWLNTDVHFNKRMPEHFKNIGMLSREHHATNSDIQSEDLKEKEMEEHREVDRWRLSEIERLRGLNVSEEEMLRQRAILKEGILTKRNEIFARYRK